MSAGRRSLVSAVAVLAVLAPMVSVAGASSPAPVRRMGNPAINGFVAFLELAQGRAISNRVFTNVDAEVAQVTSNYDRYEATAAAANDARVVQMLQQERATKLQLLQQMRNNAYQQFRKPEMRKLLSAVANLGPVNRIFVSASSELVGLAGQVDGLRTQLANGAGLNVGQVQQYAAQIDRWRGAWAILAGSPGRTLTAMADKAAAALRKVTKTAGAVDAELASTQEGLLALSQAVANVRQGSVRPRGGGFFGFITNLLGVDRRLIDAMRDLIRPRLRAVPGYSAADIDKLLDAAMIEMMRRRLWDCGKPTGFELAALPDNAQLGMFPGELVTGSGPLDEQLAMCGNPTTEQLLATGEAAMDPVADDGVPATHPNGGGVYTLDPSSTAPSAVAQMVNVDGGDLSVRDTDPVPMVAIGGDAIGVPDVQLIVDLAEGTVSGSFDVLYECTPETCMGESITGYARASFGPIPFGIAPVGPPTDFPFPEHHWYELGSDSWYALEAVDIAVSLQGTDFDGRAADYTTTVRGWIEVRLSPMGVSDGALPPGWRTAFSARFDYPDTVNPQWSMWLGADANIYDARVPRPPAE